MFDSVFASSVTPARFFLMAAAALGSGFVFSWIMSFRVRSTKRFFTVTSLIPFVVASVIAFVNGSIGAGVAIGGAFGLVRFRSAQGSADEIAAILMAMGAGIAFGMGYIAYGVLMLAGMAGLYVMLSRMNVFEHRGMAEDRLFRITIPEALEYSDAFEDIFSRFLEKAENAGVKTTGMGSMFRLSYKIRMKDESAEKAFIDELRTRNGNLEISVLPYTGEEDHL